MVIEKGGVPETVLQVASAANLVCELKKDSNIPENVQGLAMQRLVDVIASQKDALAVLRELQK